MNTNLTLLLYYGASVSIIGLSARLTASDVPYSSIIGLSARLTASDVPYFCYDWGGFSVVLIWDLWFLVHEQLLNT
ncbi:hypothetical protein H6G58_01520 [Arthrospira platensis FACHB-971]|uniref:hypothetical protein n=1 Tax=Limnospira platensis TaxID=118562 RepID=UPI000A750775|nr:hypothetical protein [Arthrospira platensis FACHB-971]MDT9293855.1 hypothetical protein [Arthrospira platensis PCC 7345]MDT9309239.1 hypothetical protein [Limnospira sp. Paracas R14]QQW32307.1 hypothetical protein AP9108_20410 [Arthrospira sp. PCC 9108]